MGIWTGIGGAARARRGEIGGVLAVILRESGGKLAGSGRDFGVDIWRSISYNIP